MAKISGIVIAYNRETILETCLQSIRFVDELIVVDKSSSDRTPEIAQRYADRYFRVPWSPTVEETRAFAIEQCQHDLIVLLDDDECLNPEAIRFIRAEAEAPRFDVYALPFRHYILGRHDDRAYYWPEYRNAFFRRGALAFSATVHGGVKVVSSNHHALPLDGPAFIHHFSHEDVAAWIEKANRYTSQPDRVSFFDGTDLAELGPFAHGRLDYWLGKVREPDTYLEAVAVQRALYDIVDGLKHWEATQPDGRAPPERTWDNSLVDGPAFTHDFSHEDVAAWIEKANRYTSQPDRVSFFDGTDLAELGPFAHGRLDYWLGKVREPDTYLEAVAVQRALYDIVDGLKHWEATQPDGREAFARLAERLRAGYRLGGADTGVIRTGQIGSGAAPHAPEDRDLELQAAELRIYEDGLRLSAAAARARGAEDREAAADCRRQEIEQRLIAETARTAKVIQDLQQRLGTAANELNKTAELLVKNTREHAQSKQALSAEIAAHSASREQGRALAHRLASIEASTAWRATGPLRRAGQRFPNLARMAGRGAKLAWWTVSLQLPHRYRMWRDYPRGQQPPVLPPAEPALAEAIRIPSSPEPVVSVIVPTYGQVEFTLACLKSIAENAPQCPIEVLVVDDAYPGPEDVSLLEKVAGIRLIRNATNLGFLLSCNEAARAAKGRYIYFLNNDTKLLPGAIETLVELLDARPDVGMAGSKLVFPDGRLQEAGGIIWADASGWNYGRGEDPSRPEFNYVREVDYCSGASIMVRREVFESLRGFDEALVPAYYEDVDLAFRIREKGMKVLYEPRSVVIHYEGMSHGTDLSTGVKAHQVKNQAWMQERWGKSLGRENYANAEHVLRARDRAKVRKVILVIDHYTPEPDKDAGSRSIVGILDSLVDSGWVVKFWPHNRVYISTYTTMLERRGIEVLDERWPGSLEAWMSQNGSELDHILVVRPDVAADVLPRIMRTTDAILSFYGVDLHFARMRRQATLNNQPSLLDESVAMERLERQIWRNFDLVIYPSEEEASVVRSMSPHTLARGIVPFCFESYPTRTVPTKGHSILFVAGFAHPPNVDAALFLTREVVPALEKEIGPVKVVLAGSNPTQDVQDLAGPNVEVTGYVTDEVLSEFYDQHRVAIVPLRFGAGVKGKVVEALSRGLPLVTTSIGSQGIPGLNGVVPVHDDVAGIVAALKRLLTDDAAWLAQSQAQMDFAQRFYSRAAMQRSVLSAFEAVESAAAGHRVTGRMEAA